MTRSKSGKEGEVPTVPMATRSSPRGKKRKDQRGSEKLNPTKPPPKKTKGSKNKNKDDSTARKLAMDLQESSDEEEKEEEDEEEYDSENSGSAAPVESGDDDHSEQSETEFQEALEQQKKLAEMMRRRKAEEELRKLRKEQEKLRKEQEKLRAQAEKEAMIRLVAQQGVATPPVATNPNASPNALSHNEESEDDFQPRGLSNTQAVLKAESHVKQRIIPYIKSVIFRKIKFITSPKMFSQAFRYVLKLEKITDPNKCFRFQTTYESCFNHALNTKRSSCEQAAGKLVRKTMSEMKKDNIEFYTMDELCKLRRAVTDRETEAFHWFISIFLGCICGAKTWSSAQTSMLVSEAKDVSGYKIVTKSDEAFGLLLIENYMEKWQKMLDDGDDVESEAPIPISTAGAGTDGRRNRPTRRRITGKYTAKKSGTTCKYGGWSVEGMARFNELYDMVKEDRACQQATEMEKAVLLKCKERAGIRRCDGNAMQQDGHDEVGGNTALEFMPVEAAWESDDD